MKFKINGIVNVTRVHEMIIQEKDSDAAIKEFVNTIHRFKISVQPDDISNITFEECN